MQTIYLVAWTGGYEPPQFYTTRDKARAEAVFGEWSREMDEDADRIHFLEIFDRDGQVAFDLVNEA